MLDVLRDAIWQSLGAILALIALAVSIWIYIKQKTKKTLVYSIDSITSLLRVHQSLKDQLEIIYQGHRVTSAHMIAISISNNGNTPIARQDYDEKIFISFTNDGALIASDIVNRQPDNLSVNAKIISDNSVELEPFLLNTNERFTIQSIVINGVPSVHLRARIVGGSVVSRETLENTFIRRIIKQSPTVEAFSAIVLTLLSGIAATAASFDLVKNVMKYLKLMISPQ